MENNIQSCCCCSCSDKEVSREIKIDYLFLDLETCDRCIGTDSVLEEVIKEIKPTFELAGYDIRYNKIEMVTAEDAIKYRFLSSPTIRVNGIDICDEVEENDCGCCGEISGTQVDCRVFIYDGKSYEVPPKAMLAEAILKKAFERAPENQSTAFELPENLKEFFEGKSKKSCCCCGPSCC